MSLPEILAAVLMVPGALLFVIAALGLHRFDDVLARMHAATKPATLGLVLIVAGVAVTGTAAQAAKLSVVVVLQFLTAPVSAHMVGRAAHVSGQASSSTDPDELAAARTPARDRARQEPREPEGGGPDSDGSAGDRA